MKPLPKTINLILIAVLSIQLTSCGTILYPERRSQDPGRIDVGVALLDGFWLFVGILPGVIAFAVDFSTGAIYLPKSEMSYISQDNYRIVYLDPDTMTEEEVERVIFQETGQAVSFSDERLKISRVKSVEEIPEYIN